MTSNSIVSWSWRIAAIVYSVAISIESTDREKVIFTNPAVTSVRVHRAGRNIDMTLFVRRFVGNKCAVSEQKCAYTVRVRRCNKNKKRNSVSVTKTNRDRAFGAVPCSRTQQYLYICIYIYNIKNTLTRVYS